jgi:hypothetical protein
MQQDAKIQYYEKPLNKLQANKQAYIFNNNALETEQEYGFEF